MGIQINGQTDTITAVDGSFTLGGSVTANVTTTSGTLTVGTGATVHSPASNTLTLGTNNAERVRINSSGSVGIGTDNPSTLLHVYGQSRFEDYVRGNSNSSTLYILDNVAISATKKLYFDTGSNTYIDEVSADTLRFTTGGTERLRMTSSGIISINRTTTTGNNRLQIYGSNNDEAFVRLKRLNGAGDDSAYGGINVVDNNDVTIGSAEFRNQDSTTRSQFVLSTYNSGSLNEVLRVKGNGNVGIGTDNPQGKLTVSNGSAGLEFNPNSEQAIVSYNRVTSAYTPVGLQGSVVSLGIGGVGEALRITSSRYVSIGGVVTNPTNPLVIDRSGDGNFSPTSATELVTKAGLTVNPDSNNSSAKFSIAKHSNGASLLQASNGSGSSTYDIAACPFGGNFLVGTTSNSASSSPGIKIGPASIHMVTSSTSGSTTPLTLYSTGASDYRFFVSAAGVIYAVSTTISSVSDQRLKENIRDLDTGLSEILALQPRRFDWKEGKGKDIQNDQGFIAQEFEQVFPEMVDDWAPSSPEGEDPYKSVRADLIPVLVKAIQEQQAMIETLQTANTSLESRLTALEGGSS